MPKRKALEEIDHNQRRNVVVSPSPPPVPRSVSPPAAPPLPAGQQLLVMQATPAALATFCSMLQNGGENIESWNQSLPPFTRALTDEDLLFPQALSRGHCHALYTRTRQRGGTVSVSLKLTERGSNNDSPRTNLLQGLSGRKVYIYHIIAAHRARTDPSLHLNPALLATVSQSKPQGQTPMTILHLCGHKWCLNADHFAIGTKRFNDEQTSCHRGLQSARTREEYDLVETAYCRHVQQCWTVVYKTPFHDAISWS